MYSLPELRHYQKALRQRIEQTDAQNCVAQLPTGTGKTLVMLDLALNRVVSGQTVLIAVPTLELILNFEYDLKKFAPWIYRNWYCAINSKIGKFVAGKKLYVATYGSIDRYKKLIKPDIIIIDEVHHARAPKFDDLLLYWSGVWQIGFTATPIRFDGKSLKKRFPVLLLSDPISWFIEQGFLSDYDIRVDEHTNRQFSFADNLTEQQSIFDKFDLVGDALRNYQAYGAGRKAIVFATGKDHAQNLADQYNEYTPTRCVLGETPQRTEWLQEFDNDNHSQTRVLTNVGVITEGVNLKSAKVAQLCRHTGSLSLFLQMLGRVLRPTNERALIIDHAGNVASHGEPKDFIDWQALYDKHEVNIDHFDRDSLFFQCQACDAPVMSLLESKKAKQLICPQCGYDNFFKPLTPTQLKSLEISNDLLVEYQSVSQSIRFLARVTQNKKMRLPDKIQAIVNCDAARDEKKAALLSLEISADRIDNLYLRV